MNLNNKTSWIPRSPQKLSRFTQMLRLGAGIYRGFSAEGRSKPIQVLDVGARNGLSRGYQWMWRAGLVAPTFIEPEPEEANRLRERYPDAQVIECALGKQKEKRSLYVTRQPGCSSLLMPRVDPRAPAVFREMYEVVRTVEVSVEPAHEVFASSGLVPEVLKLDVQGFELEILQGLGPILRKIDVVEVEVSFVATYSGQPLIEEVLNFMLDNGFGLTHIAAFGVAGTGSAIQANALFGNREKLGKRQQAIEDIALRMMGAGYAQ